MTRSFLFILILFVISGCAVNGHVKYYNSPMNGAPIESIPALIANDSEPELWYGTDEKLDYKQMIRMGYLNIGYSSFNGPINKNNNPLEKARQVKAAIVILYSKYLNTVDGSAPFPIIKPSQLQTTNIKGTISDSYGISTINGKLTPTTPTELSYINIPYKVDRYEQTSTYWVKTRKPIFGAKFITLTDAQKKLILSNKGVYLAIIIDDTPAFKYDFLEGDIITKINDQVVDDVPKFSELLEKYAATEVNITYFRNNESKTKSVKLNPSKYIIW